MSADQALRRAQERNYRNSDDAVDSGLLARLQKNMNVTLKTLTGGSIKLVSADGTVTPEGLHYYNNAGVDPPSVFAYEQPLESGKWVRGVDGNKKLARRMGADGHWHPTKIGLEYFKYNRDAFQVEYPVRIARPVGNGKKSKRMEWVLDRKVRLQVPRRQANQTQPGTYGWPDQRVRAACASTQQGCSDSRCSRSVHTDPSNNQSQRP